MTKGKPWDIDEERQLRQLVEDGKNKEEISRIMVRTQDSIRQKMADLNLKFLKEERRLISGKKTCFSSSTLIIPEDLPNVEKTLKILAAALLKSAQAGLSKEEVNRLQVVANLAKTYKEAFADYLDYRGIEERLSVLESKLDGLDREKDGKDIQS